MNKDRIAGVMLPLGIFIFGFVLSLWYGGQGLNPLDSSIIFDGAWRLICGQSFFHDFSTPNGFVPIGIQAVFFRVFGVNWLAYCLHAAVLNGLFALLVYDILRMSKAPRWLAGGYATLSAVVFYPPMAVPYMEQHSFFFIALAVWLVLLAGNMEGKGRARISFVIPSVALLAILSKQSPGLFVVPTCLIALAGWVPKASWKSVFVALLLGLVPAFLTFWLFVGPPWEIWRDFWEHFWVVPQALADERMGKWTYPFFKTLRTMAWYPYQTLSRWNYFHRYLLYWPFLLLAVEWIWRKWRHRPRPGWPPFRLLLLAIGLVVTCSFFMHFSENQPQNGLPFVFLSVGLGHIFYREWLLGFEFAQLEGKAWFRKSILGVSVLFLAYSGMAAFEFHQKTNVTRFVLDFRDVEPYQSPSTPARKMGFLDFQAPFQYHDLKPWELVTWMQVHEGNFLLFGDLTFLYGFTGRPSVQPYLWYHEGLTLPASESEKFRLVDAALLQSCKAHQIHYVVFEHPDRITFKLGQWECFAQTSAAVDGRKIGVSRVGGFDVWELKPLE
jgi:hypothetical protein